MSLFEVTCGFVPLTDAANLIVAHELGFAQQEGVALHLVREASWSNVRDKVGMGVYPMAQMLSPMALAMSLGVGPFQQRIDAPFVLGVNGNSFVARADIAEQLGAGPDNPRNIFTALSGLGKLRVGIPYPHSMHRELVRYWLNACGADGVLDVDFVVAPPPLLPDVLAVGEVDTFMVGEPWGSMAVERGDGVILTPGAEIWHAAPEKVLGVRKNWAAENMEGLKALIRALHRASKWCAAPSNISTLAELLAHSAYVDAPAEIIERGLRGELVWSDKGGTMRNAQTLQLGGGAVNFPWRSAGYWIGAQVAESWGVPLQEAVTVGQAVFRPDIYRAALTDMDAPMPAASSRIEGALTSPTRVASTGAELVMGPDYFFDGRIFDPFG